MNNWMFKELIAFASELAVGQILCLSRCTKIFYFSRRSRRVAGKGWKALYANSKLSYNSDP